MIFLTAIDVAHLNAFRASSGLSGVGSFVVFINRLILKKLLKKIHKRLTKKAGPPKNFRDQRAFMAYMDDHQITDEQMNLSKEELAKTLTLEEALADNKIYFTLLKLAE